MKSVSLVKVECEKLKVLCENTKAWVLKRQKEKDEQYRQWYLEHINGGFFNKLFKTKPLTLADFTDKDVMEHFPWSFPSNISGAYLDVAEKILKTIEVSSDGLDYIT